MTLRNTVASIGMLGLMAISASAQPKIEKVPPVSTNAGSGKEMYTAYCAVCHGTLGKGDGPAATALKKAPADLTQLAAKNGGKFPNNVVYRYISGEDTLASHGSRDMPIWGKVFHSMESDPGVDQLRINNLTNFVKSLQAK